MTELLQIPLNCVMSAFTAAEANYYYVKNSKHMALLVRCRPHPQYPAPPLNCATVNGGFAEYCAYPAGKVFKFHNLSDVDATLLEPAACAAHGLEKIAPKFGSSVLMFGAGPTGTYKRPY